MRLIPRVEVAQGVCPVLPEENDEGAVAGELQGSGHPADGLGLASSSMARSSRHCWRQAW